MSSASAIARSVQSLPLYIIGTWQTSTAAIERDYRRADARAAGLVERPERGQLDVTGPDAAEFLQGQVTNDVLALEPGAGCYAAMLNPKGRILADMRVLARAPEELWLDTAAGGARGRARATCACTRSAAGRDRRPHHRALDRCR